MDNIFSIKDKKTLEKKFFLPLNSNQLKEKINRELSMDEIVLEISRIITYARKRLEITIKYSNVEIFEKIEDMKKGLSFKPIKTNNDYINLIDEILNKENPLLKNKVILKKDFDFIQNLKSLIDSVENFNLSKFLQDNVEDKEKLKETVNKITKHNKKTRKDSELSFKIDKKFLKKHLKQYNEILDTLKKYYTEYQLESLFKKYPRLMKEIINVEDYDYILENLKLHRNIKSVVFYGYFFDLFTLEEYLTIEDKKEDKLFFIPIKSSVISDKYIYKIKTTIINNINNKNIFSVEKKNMLTLENDIENIDKFEKVYNYLSENIDYLPMLENNFLSFTEENRKKAFIKLRKVNFIANY